MRNINGTNYISVKEYAALKNVTIGRVSQMKSDLPFEKFEDFSIELINFDLLQLEEKEAVHAQTKFQTTHPLHTYTYKQMGMFVVEMAKTGNEARANAETLLIEKDAILAEKNQQFTDLQQITTELNRNFKEAQQKIEQLSIDLGEKSEALEAMKVSFESEKSTKEELEHEKQANLKTIEELNTIQQKLQANFEMKVVENQGLINENSIHKVQQENLGKELVREKELVQTLRQELSQALTQKEQLTQEQAALKLSQQQAIHDKEMKEGEMKALQKENSLYVKQIETLTKNVESGSGFMQRLDKLEGIILSTTSENPKKSLDKKPIKT